MRKHNPAFYNFSKLSANEKMKIIVHADFNKVLERKFLKYNIELHYTKMGDFFVEMWFDTDNNLFNMFPFTTTGCLKPYLDNIDISNLYQ